MSEDIKQRAENRLSTALAERGLADPRQTFRARLRVLRETDPDGFERALRHYEEDVLPALAGDADPVETWVEYGRFLAGLSGPGRLLLVDATGRAEPYRPPLPRDTLLLHVPEQRGARAVALAIPGAPSLHQQATLDLLVHGRLGD